MGTPHNWYLISARGQEQELKWSEDYQQVLLLSQSYTCTLDSFTTFSIKYFILWKIPSNTLHDGKFHQILCLMENSIKYSAWWKIPSNILHDGKFHQILCMMENSIKYSPSQPRTTASHCSTTPITINVSCGGHLSEPGDQGWIEVCHFCYSKHENEVHFLLNCAKYAVHHQGMIAQLNVALPQHITCLANFNTNRHQHTCV